MKSNKTVLITGGCGFIGFNLMLKLRSDPSVKCIVLVDNFITSSKAKIQDFIESNNKFPEIVLIEGDICEENIVLQLKEIKKVDEIYHLASLASPVFYKKFPIETLDVGYTGTKNMLELCRHWNQLTNCKFLYTSTSEVYGDPLEHPQKEIYYGNVNTCGSRSCYDSSKRVAETLVHTYTKLYNLDTKIARIFNTYGPHMSIADGRIITELMQSMIIGKPIVIYGGSQTRSFTYIDDTISMVIRLMEIGNHEPVNIGTNFEISINELVEKCQQIYKKLFNKEIQLKCVYKNKELDDPKLRRPCLQRNNQLLFNGKPPTLTSIDDGLLKTFLYFERLVDFGTFNFT